ncbi:MAG: DEAD/DEAH box helicase [Clostridia bacterium]|nr:DEAD/DEAH box helicase [Clostridia bacterium]
MARPIDSKSAKQLLSLHKVFLQSLKTVSSSTDKYSDNINSLCRSLLDSETQKILRNTPVEELNRDKRGFRTKTLRDNGYGTIADLYGVAVSKLAQLSGISDEAAVAIKTSVDQLAKAAKDSAKIRLSTDDRNPLATELVVTVSKYLQLSALAEKSAALHKEGTDLQPQMKALSPATSGIKWMFASKGKKEAALQAFAFLQEKSTGDYGNSVRQLTDSYNAAIATTDALAWADFSENSVSFYNVLEKINPQLLGNNDTEYGLPEELAKAIKEEPFYSEGLNCTLRNYQEWGVKYILHQKRVLLGDEMGLGKTVQAIASMVSLRNTGASHFVVVCPASVVTNWCREIAKMSDLSVTKVHGADRASSLQHWKENGGVAVTTFETTEHFTLGPKFRFSALVVDEAHYIKNPEARRTVNVKNISTHAERILFMTGTALENKVEEMVSLIRILQPQIADGVRGLEFLSSAPEFREKVAPVYYRRRREDVLTELPDLIESREWCTLGAAEEAKYENSILSKNYADARRVSWNVDNIADSSKANRLLEIVEEAEDDGRKVIVFSFFLDTIDKVTSLLGSRCMSPINGSVTPARRQEIIDEFDKAPAGSVLAAQIQSGGTGLNIQSASVVILCEPQFKPSIENQAISRAYRMGQTRNVLVYRLLCDDTVDERILALLESKQAVFDAFADESVVAEESFELDERSFGNIIDMEIERINAKTADKPEE